MKKFLLKEKDIDGNQSDKATYLNKGMKGNYNSICFASVKQLDLFGTLTDFKVSLERTKLDVETLTKWYDHLNVAYDKYMKKGTKMFHYDPDSNTVKADFRNLYPKEQKKWNQILTTLTFARMGYEEYKPLVVQIAVYYKDKYPEMDLMHCITAADILVYSFYYPNKTRNTVHSLFFNYYGTTITFNQFINNLHNHSRINDTMEDSKWLNPNSRKLNGYDKGEWSAGFKLKVKPLENTPTEVISKFFEYTENMDEPKKPKQHNYGGW